MPEVKSREWIHVYDHCEALFRLYLKGKLEKVIMWEQIKILEI